MGKELVPQINAEQLRKRMIGESKAWMKQHADSIKGHFPTLSDGKEGLVVAHTMTSMYSIVLRPNGELFVADLDHTPSAKEPDRRLSDHSYLNLEILTGVQKAVEAVKIALAEDKPKSNIFSGLRQAFGRK